MSTISYYLHKIASRFAKDKNEYMNIYFRKCGCIVGNNTHIFSNISTSESFLISIGNNTTIATDVKLLTHDASPGTVFGRENYTDLCGRVKIGNNCFIGSSSIIMYGVTIPDNTIVAAGSVVVKSIKEPGLIIGGNPAHTISSIERYKENNKDYFLYLQGLGYSERKRVILEGKLIER